MVERKMWAFQYHLLLRCLSSEDEGRLSIWCCGSGTLLQTRVKNLFKYVE